MDNNNNTNGEAAPNPEAQELVYVGKVDPRKFEEGTFQTCTDEAWDWMTNPTSIAGACAPIDYCGVDVFSLLAGAQRKTLTLDDAKAIVQPDGEITICAATHKPFQPVKFISWVDDYLKVQLSQGVPLSQVVVRRDGSYYCGADKKPIAFSGARYIWIEAKKQFGFDFDSPLYLAAIATGKALNKRIWAKEYRIAMRENLRKDMLKEIREIMNSSLVVQIGREVLQARRALRNAEPNLINK